MKTVVARQTQILSAVALILAIAVAFTFAHQHGLV